MAWQFWIDRGGTFTDIVARRPDGQILATKLLSENPELYEDAAVTGMRQILGLSDAESFPSSHVDVIKMGTTVATNALLERTGEPTVLAITKGFADALIIGTQHRPRLFDLNIERPDVLYSETIEIEERLFEDGLVETPLNTERTIADLTALYDKGYRSLAVALVHADRHPTHEREVEAIARDIGFQQVSTSHDVIPLMKLIGRGDTTVADAYLSPVLRRYIDRVENRISGASLLFMQSNGGLTKASEFRGKDAILSGPAGGVVGLAGIAEVAGLRKVIGFDMGGTSTDVSHYKGVFERTFDSVIAGTRIRAPMMHIHTVAAGGGSICMFDGLRLRVGPESAGANPGPAAYRRGGPLTVTDCNILLGRVQAAHFPSVFGPNGDLPLDIETVRSEFGQLTTSMSQSLGKTKLPEEIASGYIELAVENMANAIKTISIQKGYDLTEYTLVSFGGAGGQHACDVADALGIDQILIHPLAGVLSAYGMGFADLRVLKQQSLSIPLLSVNDPRLTNAITDLTDAATAGLIDQGIAANDISVLKYVLVRYEGSDTTLTVPFDHGGKMRGSFEKLHKAQFGFVHDDKTLIAEAVSVEAVGGGSRPERAHNTGNSNTGPVTPIDTARLYTTGQWRDAPVFDRETLVPGNTVLGPALIVEANSTLLVQPNWCAEVNALNHILVRRTVARPIQTAIGTDADPIKVEVFNSLFMSIAERMGAALQNTAHSVNIKERLDFSCAIFDSEGALVANAPHMPVHLGSMGQSVRAVLAAHKSAMSNGDAYITNAPYNGGTHLPDVTVVAPVFDPSTGQRIFFVAARGHHADIGGISPGSMPPGSKTIDEEGVLFDAMPLLQNGKFEEEVIRTALVSAHYPARNPDQNLADLKAQLAACNNGISELLAMIDQYGIESVLAYTGHVQRNAEEAIRRAIETLDSGRLSVPMDEGSTVSVSVTVDKSARSVVVDFSGTSEQSSGNFNAPAAVCRAAVLYVFRTLVQDDIPMNEGCLKPIQLVIPENCLLNPIPPAAVVAGNVETSQIICDALYGALGQLAASQGTMNNLTFGDSTHQYYETICGGTGAGPTHDGADAIQSHMTNSRLTDPEVLEWRYPVLVKSFGIRKNSGGSGRFKGGDGVVRSLQFRAPMSVSILSGRRTTKPFGLAGGSPGQPGKTLLHRRNGTLETLAYADTCEVEAGDMITVLTPGGGGYGPDDNT